MNKTEHFSRDPREQMFYRVLGEIMTFTATGDKTLWGLHPPNMFMRINRYVDLTKKM